MLINILLNPSLQHCMLSIKIDQSGSSMLLYVLNGVCILLLKLPPFLKKKIFHFYQFKNLHFFFSFNSSSDLGFNDVAVYEIFQCSAEINFDHRICRITVFIDSLNFGDFFSLVGLPKTHYINHQTFFYDAA